jgi:putative addiction module component (TIGR02574 family)
MINKELQNELLKLNALDKIHLVEMLIESLDKPDPEIMGLWIKESEKRYSALKEGKVKSVPYEDVIDRLKGDKS